MTNIHSGLCLCSPGAAALEQSLIKWMCKEVAGWEDYQVFNKYSKHEKK